MTATHKLISQMASTSREQRARFALQMAEQARKFGARVAELRAERDWRQRDLAERMQDLGDKAINTSQISRYETGNGPLPEERRRQFFAGALETTEADLLLGPIEEREPVEPTTPDNSPLDALSEQASESDLVEELHEIRDENAKLRDDLASLQVDVRLILSLLRPDESEPLLTGELGRGDG